LLSSWAIRNYDDNLSQTGMVGAYLTSGDADVVRRVRDLTGRVTVSGKSGLKALNRGAAADVVAARHPAWGARRLGRRRGDRLLVRPVQWSGSAAFNKEFRRVPNDVRADAQMHDVASWVDFRNKILGAADPQTTWADACAVAERVAANLVKDYKVSALTTPASLKFWA